MSPLASSNDLGCWRNHIRTHWAEWRLGDIGRIDVQSWVRAMQKNGVGNHMVRMCYNLLVGMLGDTALEGILGASPCQGIDLPAGHAAMTELMVYTGLRWGEAAAMVGAERDDEVGNPVDWLRGPDPGPRQRHPERPVEVLPEELGEPRRGRRSRGRCWSCCRRCWPTGRASRSCS
jgi:hypothetical protein